MQTQSVEEIVKIQPRGIITIPVKIRKKYGIEKNDLFKFREEKGRLILEPVRTLDYPVRSYKDSEVDSFLAEDKKETKKLRKKKLI